MVLEEMESIGTKIVVIGGGTGSFTLLSELKNYTQNLTALVNMVDDGGSTGQLRDELGVLPAGDVRQCLVALSTSPKVRELFNYRFDEGSMKGHAFGNLFNQNQVRLNIIIDFSFRITQVQFTLFHTQKQSISPC